MSAVRFRPQAPEVKMKRSKIKMEILAIENRIALLRGRSGRENGKIIRKLERRLRRLRNER